MFRKPLLVATLTLICSFAFAQDKPAAPVDGWKKGAGFGLSLDQLLLLNPKVGAGSDRIALGGQLSLFANLIKGKIAWDNNAAWNLGMQKLGSGLLNTSNNTTVKQPWQKSIDDLRFNSKLGFQLKTDSKFYVAIDLTFLSQLTSTYSGGYMKKVDSASVIQSKFFAPAFITLGVGINYKPTDKLSFFYSPIAYKGIFVSDDVIAQQASFIADGKKADHQVGSLLKMLYADKLFKDKMTFKSNLALYTNYLRNPQNIDIDWTNEIGYELFKGFQIALFTNLFYDDDVQVQITDYNSINGVNGLGKRVSFAESLLLKYNMTF